MKVLFYFLLTILLIIGIGGCDNCDLKRYVDINNMYVSAIHAGWQGYVEENYPVSFDSVIIKASFSGTFYGNNSGNKSNGFLPSAIASEDCDHGTSGSKETIKSITVIALTDFDNVFKANDTLNSIMEASKSFYSGYLNNPEFKSLNLYLTEIQPGIATDVYGNGGLYLKLKRKPTQKVIKLRVDVGFTNGENYSDVPIPITIK